MAELAKMEVYACALAMPSPSRPRVREWVQEIARHVTRLPKKEPVYLVGHSLGVPAILRYLEKAKPKNVRGLVLVSGPLARTGRKAIDAFLPKRVDGARILKYVRDIVVIHGDNDAIVPLADGQALAEVLQAPLLVIKNGAHLNGSAGFRELPACLTALQGMLAKNAAS